MFARLVWPFRCSLPSFSLHFFPLFLCFSIIAFTEYDWRNGDVRHAIKNARLEHVKVLPFRDLTAPLFNMHPSTPDAPDCTHFCYFPQMWQSIWFDLRTHIRPGDVSNRSDRRVMRRRRR
jgi:hypothetical protein